MAWIWVLIFAYATPELLAFFRSARYCFFKAFKLPPFLDLAFVMFMETCHVVGIAILVFVALPEFDTAHAGLWSVSFNQDCDARAALLWL